MDKRETLLSEAKALLSKVETENRVFTEEEQAQYDKHLSDIKALDAQTAAANALADLESPPARRQLRQAQPEAVTQPDPDPTPAVVLPAGVRRHKALRAFKDETTAYKFGQFMLGTIYGRTDARDWCARHGMLAQAEGSNSAGGYLVPDQFEQSIIDLREQYGVFRREARVRPMASDTLIVPRRASGLTAYYVGEAASITDSSKGWDAVQLVAKKLAALTYYSSEVAEDAIITMADDLASEMAYAFAYQEDLAGFLGTGTSTYGGIQGLITKTGAGSTYTPAAGSTYTSFGALTLTHFHGMVAMLPLYARANAKWYISAAGYATSMERLAYAAGGNTVQTIGGGMGLSFLGYPVVLSQVMNATLTAQASTSGLAYFGDLRLAATMGSRRGVSVAVSDQFKFDTDQLAIRATERFDINVHDAGTASAAGPIIMLATPAN